ncbi:MAG: glycosyltransferase family 2 protein [Acidobacteria bacterium]|nr:glycosyltransferase family 2 protein [Acidobacteriota bacterium]
MTQTTAVIVTYNSEEYIRDAVESCLAAEIVVRVIDNGSVDDTVGRIPKRKEVTVVRNSANAGFAGGVNQGVRAVDTPYVLLLNPDARLTTSIEALERAVGEEGHMAAAGMLVAEDKSPQKGFTYRNLPTPAALAFEVLGINRIWPANPVNRRYRCLDADLLVARTVEQPAAAFLLFRREVWESLGGFDERFHPVWFEDVDFCKRILAAGGTIQYDPVAKATHLGGHSVQKIDFGERMNVWYASLLKYVSKHFSPFARRVVAAVVVVGVVPRVLFRSRRAPQQSAIAIILQIWRMAGTCFFQRASSFSPSTKWL